MRHNLQYMGDEINSTFEKPETTETVRVLWSPTQVLGLSVGISDARTVWYELKKGNETIISRSNLSLLNDAETNLLTITGEPIYKETLRDETWEQPWGEQRFIRDNHNELALISETFIIRFRLFDDSFGFRYELLGDGEVTIAKEYTEFAIDPTAEAWWIPALGQNHYEHLYKKTPLSGIDTAHTALAIELPTGKHIAIHEAALYNYGAMNVVPTETGLVSSITPLISWSVALSLLKIAKNVSC